MAIDFVHGHAPLAENDCRAAWAWVRLNDGCICNSCCCRNLFPRKFSVNRDIDRGGEEAHHKL